MTGTAREQAQPHPRAQRERADAAQTRDALLRTGARLISRHGLGVPVSRIQDEAEQRNKSAIRYHFGSVYGLAAAVVQRHGRQVDARRAKALDALRARHATPQGSGAAPESTYGLREVVELLVRPAAAELHTAEGRDYLRLLPQVTHLAEIRSGEPKAPPAMMRTLELLRALLDRANVADIDERLALVAQLHGAAMADRASRIDDEAAGSHDLEPGHERFVRLLTGMLTAALTARP
jgi:AcrR family transcriptional regulator